MAEAEAEAEADAEAEAAADGSGCTALSSAKKYDAEPPQSAAEYGAAPSIEEAEAEAEGGGGSGGMRCTIIHSAISCEALRERRRVRCDATLNR